MQARYLAALAIGTTLGCSPKVPEPWAALGMPAHGLESVRKETNQDRFCADYKGMSADELLTQVERALDEKGYTRVCTQFEGRVRGYAHGPEKLLAKVDSVGPVLALTAGNQRGSDKLLYGICFEGYQLGEPKRVK